MAVEKSDIFWNVYAKPSNFRAQQLFRKIPFAVARLHLQWMDWTGPLACAYCTGAFAKSDWVNLMASHDWFAWCRLSMNAFPCAPNQQTFNQSGKASIWSQLPSNSLWWRMIFHKLGSRMVWHRCGIACAPRVLSAIQSACCTSCSNLI